MKTIYGEGSSGIQGFYGITDLHEYKYQKYYKKVFKKGYNFDGMDFTAKTVTLNYREGNTALEGFRLRDFLPKSIWVSPRSFLLGYALNAIGLSNPGLKYILEQGYWQERKGEKFVISIQLESDNIADMLAEIGEITRLLNKYLPRDKYPYILQINLSCPNTEHDIEIDELSLEKDILAIRKFKEYIPGVEIWLKYNALVPSKVIGIMKRYCDGFAISNTIPFGTEGIGINWKYYFLWYWLFGKSPLERRLKKGFAGGLSGILIRKFVLSKIQELCKDHPDANFKAGGGIMRKKHVDPYVALANVVRIVPGSVAFLRPWRLQGIIQYANEKFAEREAQKQTK